MDTFDRKWQAQLQNARNKLGLKHDWRYYVETPAPERWDRILRKHHLVQRGGILLGNEVDSGDPLYIQPAHIQNHIYIKGRTRVGKSRFLQLPIWYHLNHRQGFGVIDAHADLVEAIKGDIACYANETGDQEIFDQVIIIDPTDPVYTVTFNPLELPPGLSATERGQKAAEYAQALLGAFSKIWPSSWGNRMANLLRSSLIALAEADLTLAELSHFLTNSDFRRQVLEKVSHHLTRRYFEVRYDPLTDRARAERIEPVLNKMDELFSDNRVSHMFSFPKSSFNLRQIMDEGKILLVKVPKGELDQPATLLGSLLMARIMLAAYSRADIRIPSQRKMWYLYIDEFQNFASDTFEDVLAESAKYAISFIMAHQYDSQIPTSLRHGLGNPALQIYFRPVDHSDAATVAQEIFQYAEYEVKQERRLQSGEISYTYRSSGEQRARLTQEVQNLPPRQCYVRETLSGRVTLINTADKPDPWQVLGMGEGDYLEYLDSLPIGRKYLVERAVVEAEAKQRIQTNTPQDGLSTDKRILLTFISDPGHEEISVTGVYDALKIGDKKGTSLKESLMARGYIAAEIEVQLNSRGRPSKVLIPTWETLELLGIERPSGRGGPIHRRVQQMIAQRARAKGYLGQIEERLSNEGFADVHLEKDGERIAVEVAIVSTPAREIDHIANAFDADYDRVVCVFADERLLEKVRETMGETLSAQDTARVTLLPHKQMMSFL